MRVLVIGGGIGGLTAAVALRQRGVEAVVFERAPSLSQIEVGGAIHVWHNGMRGFQQLGLAKEVEDLGGSAAKLERTEFCNTRGDVLFGWSVADDERRVGAVTVGVVRPELHRVLTGALDPSALQLGANCTGYDDDGSAVVARFADGREEHGDALVGADGLRSLIRSNVLGDGEPRYAGYSSWQSFVDVPSDATPPNLLRVLFGRGARFLFYRVDSRRLYWEAIMATPPGGQDVPGKRKETLLRAFAGWQEPVEALIAGTDGATISRMDIYHRPPTKRWGSGRVTLLGDAAHPMTNALGQGANQAIEDGIVLAKQFTAHRSTAAALRAYESERIKRANGMVRVASMLTRLARWRRPWACAVRNRIFKGMSRRIVKQQQEGMAYEF